jgi:hypothetical protein
MRDPVRNDPGFPAPRAGQDQEGGSLVQNGLPLGRVEWIE